MQTRKKVMQKGRGEYTPTCSIKKFMQKRQKCKQNGKNSRQKMHKNRGIIIILLSIKSQISVFRT